MEAQMKQLNLHSEREKRDIDAKHASDDSSVWMSAGMNDDSSKRLLMELLHPRFDSWQSTTDEVEMPTGTSHEIGRHDPGINSANRSLNPLLNQDMSLNQQASSIVGSYGSTLGVAPQRDLDGGERLPFNPHSRVMADTDSTVFSSITDASQVRHLEAREIFFEQAGLTAITGDILVNILRRPTSLETRGYVGLYDEKIGAGDSLSEKRVSATVSKKPENILLKRPLVSRVSSAVEGFSERTSNLLIRGQNSFNAMVFEGRKLEVEVAQQIKPLTL